MNNSNSPSPIEKTEEKHPSIRDQLDYFQIPKDYLTILFLFLGILVLILAISAAVIYFITQNSNNIPLPLTASLIGLIVTCGLGFFIAITGFILTAMNKEMDSNNTNRFNDLKDFIRIQLTESETRLGTRISESETRLGTRIDKVETQISESETRLGSRIDRVERKVDSLVDYLIKKKR